MTRLGRPKAACAGGAVAMAMILGSMAAARGFAPVIPHPVAAVNNVYSGRNALFDVRGGRIQIQRPKIPTNMPWKRRRGADTAAAATAAATAAEPSKPSTVTSLVSASALILLDMAMRKIFQQAKISFPSSLAGCGALFASLLSLDLVSNGKMGNRIFQLLSPGAALLAKWLPVFFVPSLVTLPLADGLGSAAEFAKVAAVVVGGFFFTLLTTAGSVVGVSKLMSSKNTTEKSVVTPTNEKPQTPASTPAKPAKPFSDELYRILQFLTIASGITAVWAQRAPLNITFQRPMTSVFLLIMTLFSFVSGARMPKSVTKIIHPLVTCTAYTWGAVSTLGLLTGLTFRTILQHYYRTGRFSFRNLRTAGAGDLLLFLLGPAVISLAISMYDKRKLMKENLAEVITGITVSSFGGLFGTAAAVRAIGVASSLVRTSLLSRNITSPLAMAIANILMGTGADVSLAVSMVVVTGLIGANFGARILTAFGITDPVARGLGMGAAAHGLGTAAIVNEDEAFPFAAIGMALTASMCTVLVSIEPVKKMVLKLALG